MEAATVNNGVEMPALNFGTYLLDDYAVCKRCVSDALEAGCRGIDTAHYHNEAAVGRAIRHRGIPSKDIFLTTKLLVKDNSCDNYLRAVERQMGEMGTDYLDLLLIHHPYGDVYGAWRAMQELCRQEVLRMADLSNFEAYRLMALVINNEMAPVVLLQWVKIGKRGTEEAECGSSAPFYLRLQALSLLSFFFLRNLLDLI